MHSRLQEIIRYKTNGKQTVFAQLLGWTPQYLAKLLRVENFGIQPLIKILSTFPELDARWLLLGQGDMLTCQAQAVIRKKMLSHVQHILELEKFIKYMTPEQLNQFEKSVISGKEIGFSDETIRQWKKQELERRQFINQAVHQAGEK